MLYYSPRAHRVVETVKPSIILSAVVKLDQVIVTKSTNKVASACNLVTSSIDVK